jgi:ATP-binding cassette subfamily F protein 3
MILEIQNINKAYGGNILFRDCSARLGMRDRVGLVGPNGSGKTTLFRIMAGEEAADGGEISTRRGVQIGFLSQDALPARCSTLLDEIQEGVRDLSALEHKLALLQEEMSDEKDPRALEMLAQAYGRLEEIYARKGGYTLESRAEAILQGLGFREKDFHRSPEEFSGGWRMRLSLARILLADPDLLLLDEPTNHLDLDALIWLENYLFQYMGTLLMVSHDRNFLNRIAGKIWALEARGIVSYTGNFDDYLRAKEKKTALLEAAFENQQRKIEQTERFIERFRYKATKARQVQSRVKRLEKIDRIELPGGTKSARFAFPQPARSGRVVTELRDLRKAYGEVQVYAGVDLVLHRGDKIALVGPNGAGKSTLIKLLAGLLDPDGGTISRGIHVTTAYFAQHQLELLDPSKTVWEEIFSLAQDESISFLRGLLGAFLFSGEDVEKRVSVLSGGEKSRLVLAKMMLRPANFLLLDEPTNHLDMAAREVLEDALRRFQGTLAFITHDRHLINAIANKVLEVQAGRLTVYPGDYDDYLYKKELERRDRMPSYPASPAPEGEETETGMRRRKERKRYEAEMRNQFYRQSLELRQRIQTIESSLEPAAQEMETLAARLADPEEYRKGGEITQLLKSHARAKKRVEDLTREWEELAEKLEEIDRKRGTELGNGAP